MKKLWALSLVLLAFAPLLMKAENTDSLKALERRSLEKFVKNYFTEQDIAQLKVDEFRLLGHLANSYSRIGSGTYGYEDLRRLYKNSGAFIEPNAKHLNTFMGLMGSITADVDRFDTSYAKVLFYLTNTYRNANKLTQADSLNNVLKDYCGLFDENIVPHEAKVYVDIHENLIMGIQGDIEKAYQNSLRTSALAEKSGDTALIVTANYYLADYYVKLGDIRKFLETVERNYKMDSAAVVESDYKEAGIGQWLDALIYLNEQPLRISQLLGEISERSNGLIRSLEYRLNWLAKLSPDNPYYKQQLGLYGAANLIELVDTFDKLAKERLDGHLYTNFLTNAARVFHRHGYHQEAMQQYGKALKTNRKVYSEQLSKELAEIEAKKVSREKDEEIRIEQAKKQRYIVIAISAGLLVVVVLLAFVNQRRQASRLRAKNDEIERQRRQLEKADNEKALLIKEIHHRVKNNFQVVSSLLELQTRGIQDAKAKELAEEGQNRVKSMALIHQRLYQNDDLLISFDEYTHALVDEISALFDIEVEAEIDTQNLAFDIDTAIPLGLILNELITNAFKYGLDENDRKLNIYFEKLDSEYKMVVKDNGGGLDPNFNLTKAKSLGLRLVNRLSQQLKGKAEILQEQGAAFAIYFKDTEMRNQMP